MKIIMYELFYLKKMYIDDIVIMYYFKMYLIKYFLLDGMKNFNKKKKKKKKKFNFFNYFKKIF